MDRITKQILIDAGVSSVKEGNATYFSVEEIREKVADVKIETTGIMKLLINGKPQNCVLAGDVKPMTEWDKKIAQTLSFNPKK